VVVVFSIVQLWGVFLWWIVVGVHPSFTSVGLGETVGLLGLLPGRRWGYSFSSLKDGGNRQVAGDCP
jgi:hypothetical protein